MSGNALVAAAGIALAVVYPGLVVGAALAAGVWMALGTPHVTRRMIAACCGVFGVLAGGLEPLWSALASPAWPFAGEVLLGPAAVVAGTWALGTPRQGPGEGSAGDAAGGSPDGAKTDGQGPAAEGSPAILLGRQGGSRPFTVELPAGIGRHVSILGETGTGKTTTIIRIVHDSLAAGYPVLITDAKGTGALREASERLAGTFGAPFRVLDPTDPATLLYNPARGEPALVANKLVGAFNFGPSAEVFRNVAQEVLPVLVHALREAGEPVTLKTLSGGMERRRMAWLSNKGGAYGKELLDIPERGRVYETGLPGMMARLNALRHGVYGPIFDVDTAKQANSAELDLAESLRRGLTYVSLPAMASGEDSELMARVLIQDAKQVAAERIKNARQASSSEGPALLVMDEFAGFREAEQINDLLLQARESRISVVLSTQHLPESAPLRKSFLSAGLLVCHRVGAQDAREVSEAIGTRRRARVTRSFGENPEGGEYERFSATREDRYEVEPYRIGRLGVGRAVVQLRYGGVRKVGEVSVEPASGEDMGGHGSGSGSGEDGGEGR